MSVPARDPVMFHEAFPLVVKRNFREQLPKALCLFEFARRLLDSQAKRVFSTRFCELTFSTSSRARKTSSARSAIRECG
jgi:hypothetical protein